MVKYDAIIVLGYGLGKNEKVLKPLRSRLDTAHDLYKKKFSQKIITLGGLTNHSTGISEAEAMKRFLMQNNVPENDVIKEEASVDTIGNVYFLKRDILKPRNWKRLIVVTSDFHVKRAKYIFTKILGKDYKLEFKPTKSFDLKTLIYRMLGYEKDFLEIVKSILKDVEPGNDRMITRLFKIHPFYSKTSNILELSDEEISSKFGIGMRLIKKYRK